MDNPLSKRTVELTLEIFRQKLDYLLFLPPGSCIIALNVSLKLSSKPYAITGLSSGYIRDDGFPFPLSPEECRVLPVDA